MTKHQKLISAFIILTLCACSPEKKDWPASGKRKIEKLVAPGYWGLDCYQSKWGKEKSSIPYYAMGTTSECPVDFNAGKFTIFDDVINGTFQCSRSDGVSAEFTVSVPRKRDTPYGHYYCKVSFFPINETYPLGSITDVMETPY